MRTAIFPDCLKPIMIPTAKKTLSMDVNNYCPVTIHPALSKVLEKIIATQLVLFINKQTCSAIPVWL
jgi:hypothetical protein